MTEKPLSLRKAVADFMEYCDEGLSMGNCPVCGAAGEEHAPGTHCDVLKRSLANVDATHEMVTTSIREGELAEAKIDALEAVRKEIARHKIKVPPTNSSARWLYGIVINVIENAKKRLADA